MQLGNVLGEHLPNVSDGVTNNNCNLQQYVKIKHRYVR